MYACTEEGDEQQLIQPMMFWAMNSIDVGGWVCVWVFVFVGGWV